MKKIKRIPTLVGIFLLVASIGAGVFLLQRGTGWISKASPGISPKQVTVTNIMADSLTVSWTTDEESVGLVKYGTGGNLDLTAGGEDSKTAKTVHYITLVGLKPGTGYQFKIISDGKLFDQSGKPFETTTALEIKASVPPSDVAYGKVVNASNEPVSGAVVYLSVANVSPLSAQTKSAGTWMIPLNLSRSVDLASFAAYDKEASVEEILVLAETDKNTTVVTTTANDSPVPDIVLGENVDRREVGSQSSNGEVLATPTPEQIGFESEEAENISGQELWIDNPGSGETVYTTQPLFAGEGPAGETLEIVVESDDPRTGSVLADDAGQWQWSPGEPLEPGEHKVTVSYTDANGQRHSLSRTFIVLAANEESLPALSSSPSGETVTPSPTQTPTPIPATPSPAAATATPEAFPTGRISVPSTESGVPSSGQATPTIVVGIIGIILLLMGTLTARAAKLKNIL